MLYLLKGRAGSGKTEYIRNIMGNLSENTSTKPVLLVPEQFSFESERAILKLLGAKKMKAVDIFSFPRMALSSLKYAGIMNSNIPDKGVKSVIMSEALVQLDGRLEIFKDFRHNASAIDPLLEFCKELKYCCINSELLNEKLSEMEDCFLKNKLQELSLLNDAYEALLSQSYFDDTELLTVFTNFAIETGYFKNKTIILDGFRDFSKQECECLKVMLSQADDVYITLCTCENPLKFSAFFHMYEFEKNICTLAAKANCAVKKISFSQKDNAFSSDIFALEKNLFSECDVQLFESDKSVKVVKCRDLDDECKFVAAEIKNLVRSGGYRCRDIAIIERSNGVYKNTLINYLKGFGVPVFDDSRRQLSSEPLFIYVSSAVECAFVGLTTESVMRYLKTGFSSLTLNEISKLEKYALMWGIGAKDWKRDFTMHPDGFGESFDDKSLKRLEELNEIRKKAVLPILKLKKTCEGADGMAITEAVYNFLDESCVKDKLFELSVSLEEEGFSVESARQEVSWNYLMYLLDIMASLTNGKFCSLKRWNEMFLILVACGDIGEIPQGLDEVTIGSADRIRTEKLKVVFLVGCNKDEFPLVNVKNGILTDSDRVTLINEVGLEVRPPFEDTVNEEKFIAYCSVTAASERLYISYKANGSGGEILSPSEIVDTAVSSIKNLDYIATTSLPEEYFIESEAAAFSVLSSNYINNNTLKSTLLKYFNDSNSFGGKIASLETIAGKKSFAFEKSENSTKLFGENIYLSASRVESFFNCPFAYFVRYGLGAEPLKTATLDPAQSGTIVHFLLEKVLEEYPARVLVETDDSIIKTTVEGVLKEYLEEKMGGFEEKSKRFLFLFERFTEIAMVIISRLKVEFGVGEFQPQDFELKIGGEKIPAYELPLEKGSVKLTGYIDRVDLMEKDGVKYIRVVDYKTGKKEFKLTELLDGLNIQMVLYLMALEKNGTEYYGKTVPAGVLYLPSRIGINKYLEQRSPSEENIKAQKRVSGKLSGMVLDSPVVLNGMGVNVFPDYFPVDYNKKGTAKGNYYSLKHFKSLSKIIDDKIIYMGESLHNGFIDAVPCGINNKGKMCEYCSYKAICGREQSGKINELSGLKHSEVLKRLEAECSEQELD